MREKIRIALRVATSLAVVWVLCMFVFCLLSERGLHRIELQLQDSAARLAEEKDAYEEDRAMLTELREMKLELKSELRTLRKQLVLKKGFSAETNDPRKTALYEDDLREENGSALSELERAKIRHALFRENRMLLRKISESRHALRAYRTSPSLEALNDEYQEKLQHIHAKWRAAVQSLLNAAARGETDKVHRLQEQVRELADSADVLTGNTLLYFDQAGRVVEAADSLLKAVNAHQLLLRQSEELDAPANPETSTNP